MNHILLAALMAVAALSPAAASTADSSRLQPEAKIPLGHIAGRIDHLAFDPTRGRAYVAELGNDSVGIVDVKARRLIRTVTGFSEPQGIAYEPASDTVYVANGGDGSVRLFGGADFAPLGAIALGDDADNVRVDRTAPAVYVGYGNGRLAVVDPAARRRIGDLDLAAHPEGFQPDPAGDRIFVNVPEAGHVAVLSREAGRQIATWPTGDLRANFPLALDAQDGRVLAVFRHPARLQAYDMSTGRRLGGTATCADADDVFVDPGRHRIYVICGEGYVEVLDSAGDNYPRVGRLPTSSGSRTGLLVPEIDRLLVAIRASQREGAALWIVRPEP